LSRSLCAALFAALLSATAATAGEYLITGSEIAGRATVTEAGGGKVHVSAQVKGFGSGKSATLSGDGTSGAPGLSFKSASGAIALKPGAGGVLTGTVGGVLQTWTPAPSTKGLAVLVVPGLSTNGWNKIGIPYLDENVAALQAYGYAARRLAISTEAPVAANAAYITAQIKAEAAKGNKVILVAHSKGAVDTTAALALDKSLLASVKGVIAIQPVWIGSPMAELVKDSKLLEAALKAAIEKLFKGSEQAVLDLDFERRRDFISKHPYPAAQVPTVVVRSSFSRTVSKSPLYLNQKYITTKYKLPNDGMVLFKDQAIPGAAATIDLEDMDHFEPGLRNESKNTPLIVTTKSLLALLPKIK
jgi:predicted alpha/beta hydrolase family esterase